MSNAVFVFCSVPYCLLGDFNLKPHDDTYTLLTTGALPPGSKVHPSTPELVSPVFKTHSLRTFPICSGVLFVAVVVVGVVVVVMNLRSYMHLRQSSSWFGSGTTRAWLGSPWKCQLPAGGMRSAYVVFNGSEPEFTNFAAGDDLFCATLDYIFLSPHWKVLGQEL
jgi:hypothetical protein